MWILAYNLMCNLFRFSWPSTFIIQKKWQQKVDHFTTRTVRRRNKCAPNKLDASKWSTPCACILFINLLLLFTIDKGYSAEKESANQFRFPNIYYAIKTKIKTSETKQSIGRMVCLLFCYDLSVNKYIIAPWKWNWTKNNHIFISNSKSFSFRWLIISLWLR